MTDFKVFTLTRQRQFLTLLYFLPFLSNLLELIGKSPVWLHHFNTISMIAIFAVYILMLILNKKENEDELAKKNFLKADSFVLSALTICIMGIILLLQVFAKTDYFIPNTPNLWLTIFWFLGFSRNAAFLVYERLGRD